MAIRKSKAGRAFLLAMAAAMAFLASVGGVSADGAAAQSAPAVDEGDIVIVYTNDVHCGVSPVKDDDGAVTNIGYAGVAAFLDSVEAVAGEGMVTLVDAGDAMQGDAVGTMSKGEYIAEIVNEVGYDIFVPGNHEFDYGMERMQELMGMLDADVISSNFVSLETGEPVFDSFTIVSYGDTDVAYVGITTPESFTKSTPAYFQNDAGEYIYGLSEKNDGQDLYAAVQGAVDAATAEGADYIVAVGHLGIDEASEPWRSTDVIANTTGIDAFIDAHSHSVVASEAVKNKDGDDVTLTQTGTKLANIGCMTISSDGVIESGLVSGYDALNEDVDAFVASILESLDADLAAVVAQTGVDLAVNDPETGERMVRSRETNLGDLVADAYRYVLGNGRQGAEAGPADIAWVNGGGVRADISAGDITFGEVIAVHPFNNVGCVVEATGQEIIDALEMASRAAPEENGGFLQVSGIAYVIDLSVEPTVETDDMGNFVSVAGARRVTDVTVGGEPIDLAKTYTLASHNYMLLDGGDGINMFRDNPVVVQPVILDNQVLITYVDEFLGGVVGEDYFIPYGQGRITLVGGASAPSFTDIAGLSEVEQAEIARAAELGIVVGVGDGLFEPGSEVTALDAMTMVLRAVGLSTDDPPVSEWLSEFYTGGLPDSPISRAGVAQIVATTALLYTTADVSLSGDEANAVMAAFSDSTGLSEQAKQFFAQCVSAGILIGNGDGTMTPDGTLLRSQMASIAARLWLIREAS